MNKYVMQKSSTRPDGWVLTDTENKVVITFEDGLFNGGVSKLRIQKSFLSY